MSIQWENRTIRYWGDKDIKNFNNKIVFISKGEIDPRGRWPGDEPSLRELYHELSISRMSYVNIREDRNPSDDRTYINILTGRIVINGTFFKNDGYYKLHLNTRKSISFASNSLRVNFLKNAVRVEHHGIHIVKGDNFRRQYEEQDGYWRRGLYSKDLMAYKDASPQRTTVVEINTPQHLTREEKECADASRSVLDTLEKYIELEHAAEEAIAAQEAPFYFRNLRAEVSKNSFKQFFKAQIEIKDYRRLLNLKPSLLQVKEFEDAEPIQLDVVDLEANTAECEIILSASRQVEYEQIVNSDQFYIAALPTLKNVRTKVIESLRDGHSPNKWLVSVAAECYNYTTNIPAKMELLDEVPLLNKSQKDGIRKGSGTQDYTLVLGPPGTGKTTVILQWVTYFAKQGKRILVTSQNNKAVDNVLERLAKEESIECIRVGNEGKVSESIHDLLIDNYASKMQQKLLSKLDDALKEIENDLAYVQKIKKILPLYQETIETISDLYKEIETLKKGSYTNGLNKIHKNRDRMIEMQETTTLLNKENEIIKQYLAAYDEYSSFMGMLTAPKKLSQVFKLNRNISQISKLKLQYEKKRKATTNLENKLQKQQNKIDIVEEGIQKVKIQYQELIPEQRDSLLIKKEDFLSIYNFENNSRMFEKQIEKISLQQKKITITADKWRKSINERQEALYETLLEMVDVVGATCVGINTKKAFSKIPFDVVIVDESGQIQLHNLIVPLSRAPIAILVGDHKQLPPIVNNEIVEELQESGYDEKWIEKSWFELLWEIAPDDRKAMLDTQFRCPSIISDFISDAFYNNKYFAGEPMKGKKPILSFCKSTLVFIDTSSSPDNLESTRQTDGRTEVIGNKLETKIVTQLVKDIVIEMPELAEKNELGIIVPYANHVKEINQAIRQMVKIDNLDLGNLSVNDMVASVDSYQGQERDIILFSFTRANAQGTVGFLADWRRLNVAMTRTKKQIIMIGNFNTLTKIKRQGNRDEAFKVAMQQLKSHLKAHGQIIDAKDFFSQTEGKV